MHSMKKKSKFLPDRISGALKSFLKRLMGGIMLALGIWAFISLVMYNPYLDGFAVASTFGTQSIMGQIVGIIKYCVGFMPSLLLILCVARWGL